MRLDAVSIGSNPPHDVNVVLSETTPGASPAEQIRIFQRYDPTGRDAFSHTQVFPMTAGHHVFGLYVRQVYNLGGATPNTNFARATLQVQWIPRRYP